MSVVEIYEAVLDSDAEKVVSLIKAEIEGGVTVSEILDGGLIKAMDEVGRLYSAGEFFVPEMLASARAMKMGLEYLKPYLTQTLTEERGRVVIGTVKGDLHDIGKNIVAVMLEGAGFTVYNLGIDVPTEQFIEAIKEYKADIVCFSALLTTTMDAMRESVQIIKNQFPDVRIMVGGAPVTQDFADKIGADGYSADGGAAVGVARQLV